jgi:DamX protein
MADGEQGFLGLTHNPFVTEETRFFEGGQRKAALEQLRHLGQWSRKVTLVTGQLGAGKSACFRQLSMTLEPGVKAARINGVLVNTLRDVLWAVAQGVGASVSSDANARTIAEVLATFFIGQERQGRFCLVMVDDAHLLDFGSIEELLKLTRKSPVKVCLFGEPALVNSITRPAQRQETSWHEIRLNAFVLEETREYIDWKLAGAGFRGKLPFSPGQLARVQKMSAGLPAQINQICAELVDRLESGQPETAEAKFPVAHGLVVVLLVVVVSLSYLVLSGIETDATDHVEPQETVRTTIPLPGSDAAGVGEETASRAIAGDTVASDAVESDAVESPAAEAAAADALPAPVLTPMPDPADVSAQVEAAATDPAAVTHSAGSVDTSHTAFDEASVPAAVRSSKWLLDQSPAMFTVQLASFSTGERLVSYLAQQKSPGSFGWYPIERGGKRLYVVTYGQFATRTDAMQAAGNLPPETGKVEPWVRPMSMVQDAIRSTPR